MSRQISEERKGAYYLGMILVVIGFLIFASNFFSVFSSLGSSHGFGGQPSMGGIGKSMMTRAFLGMGFIVVGSFIRRIGARGLAGSGMILNPRQAREDLEPYSRMAGGMVKDALDEADVHLGSSSRNSEPERVIMIKCRECGKLNEEDSKFCQECGQAL